MLSYKQIEKTAKYIGQHTNAEKIILFGSYAQGRADDDSDVDFLIIADSDEPRYKRSRKVYRLFNDYPFSMDVMIYTKDEINKNIKSEVSFVSNIMKEGKVIYERR